MLHKKGKTYTNKLLCLITVLLRKNTNSPKAPCYAFGNL